MSKLDPNTWYTLTNQYAGTSSYLYPSSAGNPGNDFLSMGQPSSPGATHWQFLYSSNVYYLRNQLKGSSLQVGITNLDIYNVSMPIFQTSSLSSPDQQWTVEPYGSNFRIGNVALGTAVFLDTYANSLEPFFEPWIHSGQIWTIKSAAPINDVAFYTTVAGGSAATSTVSNGGSQTTTTSLEPAYTSLSTGVNGNVVTVTASPSSPTGGAVAPQISASSNSGLSTGAVAGIAVGASLIGVLVAALLCFYIWRRRNGSKSQPVLPPVVDNRMSQVPGGNYYNAPHEAVPKGNWPAPNSPYTQHPTAELQGVNQYGHGRAGVVSELQ